MSTRGLWALVGVLLIPPIVVPLIVPIYAREDPELWGFPFYYWFQFAIIPVAAAFTTAAYVVAKAATRRDRVARGLPADPEGERR